MRQINVRKKARFQLLECCKGKVEETDKRLKMKLYCYLFGLSVVHLSNVIINCLFHI